MHISQKCFPSKYIYQFFPLIVLILSITFLPAGESKAEIVTLAKAGVPEAVIVVSKNPAPTEKFAAQELKHYLDKITGASFKIVNERPGSGYAIILGNTEYTRKAGIDVNKLERDEFIIDAKGKKLFIAGKDEKGKKAEIIFSLKVNPDADMSINSGRIHFRPPLWDFDKATLLGAYRFLEKLGVRWFFPGPEGEVLPENKNLSFNFSKAYHSRPDYKLRSISPSFWPGNVLKYFKKIQPHPVNADEYKNLGWTARQNKLWEIRMGDTGKWLAFNHSYPRSHWKKRFAVQHPEYFALLRNGKRDLPEDLKDHKYRYHLCFTNPGVFKENLKDIDAFFSGKPASARAIPMSSSLKDTSGWNPASAYKNTFSLLPHDSFKPCRCKNCAKLLHDELDYGALSSDLVWGFVKKTALEVQKKWPGKYVTCLAYSSFSQPPVNFKTLPDNVIIGLCPHSSPPLNKTYNTVARKNYNKYMELIKRWSEYNNQPLLIWSHNLYRWAQPSHKYIPMHIPHHLGRLLKGMKKYAAFAFIQNDIDNVFYEHINRYVMQKVLWDANADVDELIDDYIKKYYGPQAYDIMKKFYADLEAKCMKIAKLQAGRMVVYESIFNRKCIDNYKNMIKQALKLTKSTKYHKRVQYVEKYIVAGIEKGYDEFKDKLSKVKSGSSVPVYYTAEPIKIDAKIDEKSWEKSEVLELVNNVNSQKPEWKTEVRFLWDKENIYFAFDCYSPNIQREFKNKEYDFIEIFLDDNNDKDSYHQILIKNNGELLDIFFEGGGEQGNPSWASGVKKAIKVKKDGWVIEGAIPIKNLKGGGIIKERQPWGMNVCRTIVKPPKKEDKFNTFSKIIVGKFAQPDLFAKIYFAKEPAKKPVVNPDNLITNSSFENWLSPSVPDNWQPHFSGKSSIAKDCAIVHSGKYSARLEVKDKAALLYKVLLTPRSGASKPVHLVLKDGKYRLTYFWRSLKGKMFISLAIQDTDNKIWHRFDPDKNSWIKSTQKYQYFIIKGTPDKWNKTEFEFTLDFPRLHGYLFFRGVNNDTLYIDDVSLEKIVK